MKLFARQPTPTEQLKDAAIDAAIRALRDQKNEPQPKSARSGGRALAAGAVLCTAGLVAFKGRHLVREQLSSIHADDDEARQAREDDGEYEREPAAAEDLEPEAVEEHEPEASEDDEDESREDDDQRGDDPDDDEPETDGGAPSGDAEPEPDEDSEELEAAERQDEDEASNSDTPTRLPKREPKRRAARKKGPQPSVDLPGKRRPRTPAGRK